MTSYREMSVDKQHWLEEQIEDVLPDGTLVKAVCRCWAKDIIVEMISPYPGLRTGLHMMYMIPRRFTDNDLWKTRALGMVETLVARGRWADAHPNAVSERRREGKRRIGIAQKYIKALTGERADWRRKLKQGLIDLRIYQQNISPINKTIQALKLIVFEQEEREWLRDGIVEPISCHVRPPNVSKHPDRKNVSVYWRDSALVSNMEKGWCCVLETEMPEADLARAGLGQPAAGRSSIDLAIFSAYLKHQSCDKTACVFEAYREIAREDDSWCATMA